MKEQVLTSKKVKVRSYEQFMLRIRLMSYSSASSAGILCIALLILFSF
jgi:hypothetical protein